LQSLHSAVVTLTKRNKGLSKKDVRSRGGLSSAVKGSYSDADGRTTSDFTKFMVCPHG